MLLVSSLAKKIFGSRNQRVIRQLSKKVAEINALEPTYEALEDQALTAKTQEFKQRLAQGETLEDLLVEAFAVVREASKRTLKERPFDVQLIGGMVLHQNKIAEMCTGEGKTLVSTLPTYLNALEGRGVHIVTVNDYLAKRDAEWMGPIYRLLGLSVGVNVADLTPQEKKASYAADITYGTNNEFGFDYLRDNMVMTLEDKVQRDLHYAIVDEVDSILIDEARTPLIISGATDDTSELYIKIDRLIPKLQQRETEDGPGDYYLDEKQKQAYLTESGHQHVEELMMQAGLLAANESLYDLNNIPLMHHLNAALRAHKLFQRDVAYILREGEVLIVDEHTGRTMPGRRWSDGLHQAVEAKENVPVRNENQTLATITLQNYFRMYNKLAGMTGTADTEAYEFQQIYGLEVIVIPTNRPLIRKDSADRVYLSVQDKFHAIVQEVKDCVSREQPVLVGTASVDVSEVLSQLLHQEHIPHQVLNAKQHEREAKIIAQAGRPQAITIATNMAGRGTDIVLGGSLKAELADLPEATPEQVAEIQEAWQKRHQQVVASGGLHIIGSERHESRRIDNQLRGRSGRQGDPGSSRFYVSLEDNLMRIFASDRVASIMKRLGMKEGESVEHSWITKAIANAQKKVENYHFDVRKQLLDFDNVANDQRKVIYEQRSELMTVQDISSVIERIRDEVLQTVIDQHVPPQSVEELWDIAGLDRCLSSDFSLHLSLKEVLAKEASMDEMALRAFILSKWVDQYDAKKAILGSDLMKQLERTVMLQSLDAHWKEHLSKMDYLRHSIHLSGYAQKDPKQEYKREAFILFKHMWNHLTYEVIRLLSILQIQAPEEVKALEEQRKAQAEAQQRVFQHEDPLATKGGEEAETEIPSSSRKPVLTVRRSGPKLGRNAPCPCGSGKKYKYCCGQLKNV